jgi:hypothetical protein
MSRKQPLNSVEPEKSGVNLGRHETELQGLQTPRSGGYRDSLHRRHRHISSDDIEALLERGFVERLSERCGVLRLVDKTYRLPLRGASSRYGDSWRLL